MHGNKQTQSSFWTLLSENRKFKVGFILLDSNELHPLLTTRSAFRVLSVLLVWRRQMKQKRCWILVYSIPMNCKDRLNKDNEHVVSPAAGAIKRTERDIEDKETDGTDFALPLLDMPFQVYQSCSLTRYGKLWRLWFWHTHTHTHFLLQFR